jgi:hypothetical protein
MNFKKTVYALALGSVGIMGAVSSINASAAPLANGDQLTINAGMPSFYSSGAIKNIASGSWFAMDLNGDAAINNFDKVALAQGTNGIIIGDITAAGTFGPSLSVPAGNGTVVDSWGFLGATGTNFNTVAITGTTTALDFSGWKVAWNSVSSIDMGGTAWGAGFADGIANVVFTGSNYVLDYHATAPADSLNFASVKYALHLEGTLVPVPEASTYGMMLAGLGLVGFMASRRRKSI